MTVALTLLAFVIGAVWGRATDRGYHAGFRTAHRMCHAGECTSWCRLQQMERDENMGPIPRRYYYTASYRRFQRGARR